MTGNIFWVYFNLKCIHRVWTNFYSKCNKLVYIFPATLITLAVSFPWDSNSLGHSKSGL